VITAQRYVGARVKRVEDARLLTGHGTYVDDIVRPGMLHACFVRSPFPRARINSVDVKPALDVAGVHAVFVADDLNPHVREQWYTMMGKDSPNAPAPPLAEGEARFVGDPVALVVAETRAIAEDASELVDVDYELLDPVIDYLSADTVDALVHEGYPNNIVGQLAGMPASTLDEVFANAPHVVRERISQQAYCAVPMETRGIVVEWEPVSRELTIWSASQAPHEVRAYCSRLLGLPEHHIRVVMRDTGGAFGQKIMVSREEMALMLAASRVPNAVKWVEDRRENLLAAGKSRREHGDVAMAFDDEGNILAAHIDFVQDAGAYPLSWPVGTGTLAAMLFPGPYKVPKATFTSKFVFTNTAGRSAYRGPWQFESVAREVLLDIGAREVGIDPVDLRRRNMLRRSDMPFTSVNGLPFDVVSPLETFEAALEILDYDAFRREQAAAREQGRYLGVGTSTYVEPTSSANGNFATEGATIRIEPSGKVNVYVAGGSAGNSIETTVVQLTADALGVDIEDVHCIQGDTAVTPYGAGTGGSRSGMMTAGAVGEAAAILRERLVALAAHRLEAAPEDIELANSRASVRGTPSVGLGFGELAHIAYVEAATLPPEVPGLEVSARFTQTITSTWANASHVCTCEVDIATGKVTLLRYIVAEDCGPMINPNVVEGQIAGGSVQGMGGVLLEHLAYDDDGNPVTTTFMDYLLPTAAEVPTIEYGHVETPSQSVGGFKGVGEGGAIGAPPAVINAVADALAPLGVAVTQLPLGPSEIVTMLAAAGS
jgi:carbon-monoxide dehydrogenase large subunit